MIAHTKKFTSLLALTLLTVATFQEAQCFVPLKRAVQLPTLPKKSTSTTQPASSLVTKIARGGAELKMMAGVENLLIPALKAGPYGILALTAVSAVAVVPLTLYRQIYSISVGYGMAIFATGLLLQNVFQPATLSVGQALTGALMFYGLRLASYLFIRDKTRKSPSPGAKKEGTFVRKATLALSVSLFYACLTTPALYGLRNMESLAANSNSLLVTKGGIGLAIVGGLLEAVGDLQKYIVKQKQSAEDSKSDQFQGPTSLTYRVCRHPNYLGEIVFWVGVFVAGVPSFGRNYLAWIASLPGLYGIVSIMKMATARLEKQQLEKYGGQEKYDTWVKKVKSPLVPLL